MRKTTVNAPLDVVAAETAQPPAAVHLDVPNTGEASFVVSYARTGASGVLQFPFISSPLDKLRVTGSAHVKQFVYDDPFVGDSAAAVTDRMTGKRVMLEYGIGTKDTRLRAIRGVLKQVDANTLTITADDGSTVMVPTSRMATLSCEDFTNVPKLIVSVDDPGKPVQVRGEDLQFVYTVHHALLLEPHTGPASIANVGAVDAQMVSFASVRNGYTRDITVNQLTLTEIEQRRPRGAMYKERAAPAMMTMAAAAAAAPPSSADAEAPAAKSIGRSQQEGAQIVDGPVVLRARQPRAVGLGTRAFPGARMYLLASFDPIVENTSADGTTISLDLVTRLRAQGTTTDDSKFLFSGPVSVTVDMDPTPGDDHVAGRVVASTYYDAWDQKRTRMYYNLGETQLVTLCAKQINTGDAHHDTIKNEHTIDVELKYANRTPYPMVVKQYLRAYSDEIVTGLRVMSNTLAGHSVDGFVPEQEDDIVDKEARTLTVVVPASAKDAKLVMRVNYSRRM